MSAGIKANNDGSAAIQVGGTDRVTLSSAGVMAVPAGIVADLTGAADKLSTASGSAPSYAARAWVNFNGAGTLTGTYSQSGTAITVTVTSHGLSVGQSVYITFQTGSASAEAFTVTSVTSSNVFVVTSATSRTTSGNCTLATIIRASGNVSSITDNGVGDYTVNFATAMPDANYSVTGSSADNNGGTTPTFVWLRNQAVAPTTLAVRIGTRLANNTDGDSAFVQLAIFR